MTPEQIAGRLRRAGDVQAADALDGAVHLIRRALDGDSDGDGGRLRRAATRVVEVRHDQRSEWSELNEAINCLADALGWVSP